jgi:hypothetical protein
MRSRSGGIALMAQEADMNRDKKDLPHDLPHEDQRDIERAAEKNRKKMDEVPPHGTDPLHEGP